MIYQGNPLMRFEAMMTAWHEYQEPKGETEEERKEASDKAFEDLKKISDERRGHLS